MKDRMSHVRLQYHLPSNRMRNFYAVFAWCGSLKQSDKLKVASVMHQNVKLFKANGKCGQLLVQGRSQQTEKFGVGPQMNSRISANWSIWYWTSRNCTVPSIVLRHELFQRLFWGFLNPQLVENFLGEDLFSYNTTHPAKFIPSSTVL